MCVVLRSGGVYRIWHMSMAKERSCDSMSQGPGMYKLCDDEGSEAARKQAILGKIAINSRVMSHTLSF